MATSRDRAVGDIPAINAGFAKCLGTRSHDRQECTIDTSIACCHGGNGHFHYTKVPKTSCHYSRRFVSTLAQATRLQEILTNLSYSIIITSTISFGSSRSISIVSTIILCYACTIQPKLTFRALGTDHYDCLAFHDSSMCHTTNFGDSLSTTTANISTTTTTSSSSAFRTRRVSVHE